MVTIWSVAEALEQTLNQLNRIERKVDRILALDRRTSAAVEREGVQIMALQDTINQLTADVTAQRTVVDGAITLLNGLTTMIADLKGQVTDPAAIAALDSLDAAIKSSSTDLANAVAANTPAA